MTSRIFALTGATVAALALVTTAGSVQGQTRPFTYSLVPAPGASRGLVYGGLGYGRDMFAALGPERLEQRAGAHLALGGRMTLVAQAGWAVNDEAVAAGGSVQADLLVSLLPASSRTVLALAVGGMRDYRGTAVAVGGVALGLRGSRSLLIGNLRLERPFPGAAGESRDALDVITTMGYTRRLGAAGRFGIEAVGEDLEGFFEADEAEGGAKLMVGPSVGFAPPRSRWEVMVGAGPVVRLTRSAAGTSGAARDLPMRAGYVIRTTIGYRW